ncbi:MAG TPA: hypothetical protein VFA58_02025, partial [Chthoniobacterales bacterium]|nr:hypothetical protein [Chthoniobacterales bacterium]
VKETRKEKTMKTTYCLLVQSEEKNRNILETALYALFALSALVTIWQFVEGPAVPTFRSGQATEQHSAAQMPS